MKYDSYVEINKSKFYGYVFEINNIQDFLKYYNSLKESHPKASHICYAYLFNDQGIKAKAFDDNEPKRTAGYPILKLIQNNNLNNIVIFVVRYFGGKKLGSGPLLRNYVKCASQALKSYKKTT